MIVFWNGLGCLVIPIIVVGFLLVTMVGGLFPEARWIRIFPVFLTALAIFGLGWLLNRRKTEVWDDSGRNSVATQGGHSLYFIPVEYWSVIALIAGIIMIINTW